MATLSNVTNKYTWQLTVIEESTNTTNNTSTIRIKFDLITTTRIYSISSGSVGGTVTVNGKTYNVNAPNSVAYNTTYTLLNTTEVITHETDGTKSISFSYNVGSTNAGSYAPGSGSGSGTMTLTKINRIATINNAIFGQSVTDAIIANYTKYVDGYTYKLRISIPNVKELERVDYNTSGASINISSAAISEIIAQIKSGQTSVKIGVRIDTYSGSGTFLGTSKEIIKELSLASAPTITNITYFRANEDGSVNDEGNYISVSFDWSIDVLGGENNATVNLAYKKRADSYYTDAVNQKVTANKGTVSKVIQAYSDFTYTFRISVTDRFNTDDPLVQIRDVPGSKTVFDFTVDSTGKVTKASLGKAAEYDDALDLPEGWSFLLDGKSTTSYKVGDSYSLGDGTDNSRYQFAGVLTANNSNLLFTVMLDKKIDGTPRITKLKLNARNSGGSYIIGGTGNYIAGGQEVSAEGSADTVSIQSYSANMLTIQLTTSGRYGGTNNTPINIDVTQLNIVFE